MYQDGSLHKVISPVDLNLMLYENPVVLPLSKSNSKNSVSSGKVTTETLHAKLRSLNIEREYIEIPDNGLSLEKLAVLLDNLGLCAICEPFNTDYAMTKDWIKLFSGWRKAEATTHREESASKARSEPPRRLILHLQGTGILCQAI